MDGSVVVLSIGELILTGPSTNGGAFGAFRSVRVFRVFRVVRLTKILRSLSFMKVIILVVSKCLQSFIYIALLLLLFIFVYSLIGMEIYGGQLSFQTDTRQNFDDFFNSILAIFQIMTLENWPDILIICLRSSVPTPLTIIFFVSWIFLGNYILLNLFLAILLDSFTSEEILTEMKRDNDDDEKKFEKFEQPKRRATYIDPKTLFSMMTQEAAPMNLEGKSIYLFTTENTFRKMCNRFVKSKFFENFILLTITASSVKLAVDTYIDQSLISDVVDISINLIFMSEACVKIVSMGFVIHEKSYLRESWNIMDFTIILLSIFDMLLLNVDLPFLKVMFYFEEILDYKIGYYRFGLINKVYSMISF